MLGFQRREVPRVRRVIAGFLLVTSTFLLTAACGSSDTVCVCTCICDGVTTLIEGVSDTNQCGGMCDADCDGSWSADAQCKN